MNTWKRITLSCLSLAALGLAPADAAFAQVRVTLATPSSAYQGTIALDVVVNGSGFDRTAKVQYFVSGTTNPGGITVRKVVFRNPKELVTTIDVAETADLASFDIQVMLDSGRKGKGTTLFSVKVKPNGAVPTYPPGRFYHAIASNGGTTTQTSRLYMFGGMSTWSSFLGDLWSYANAGSTGATWTLIPGGTLTPSPRRGIGWSCGGGQCIASHGIASGFYKETWIFSESTQAWTKVTCGRRVVCPSERMHPAMAYDPLRGVHVLFGGDGWTRELNDTYAFNGATKIWKEMTGGTAPPARVAAAAAFVADIGRIVMHGGYTWSDVSPRNDMYSWNGTVWEIVQYTSPQTDVPALWNHDVAWDPIGRRLIVTGGFMDSAHEKPNDKTWYVTFSNATGAWKATWTLASGIGCQSAAGSPPDPVVHPGAHMAYDPAALVQVFFGGEASGGASSYDNTVECR